MTGFAPIILFGIILALALNFVNGLNDASHSIATVVATKALTPIKAVFYTAICNMIGPFLFSTAVALTIGTAIITTDALTPLSIVVAMGASIVLVFVATRMGIPITRWWAGYWAPVSGQSAFPQLSFPVKAPCSRFFSTRALVR
jgi:PiT family inorganic phosphate transporter